MRTPQIGFLKMQGETFPNLLFPPPNRGRKSNVGKLFSAFSGNLYLCEMAILAILASR